MIVLEIYQYIYIYFVYLLIRRSLWMSQSDVRKTTILRFLWTFYRLVSSQFHIKSLITIVKMHEEENKVACRQQIIFFPELFLHDRLATGLSGYRCTNWRILVSFTTASPNYALPLDLFTLASLPRTHAFERAHCTVNFPYMQLFVHISIL